MHRLILAGAAIAALASHANAATGQDAAVAAGAQVFQRCSTCHSVTPGSGSTIGPHLNGVVGRKAGSFKGYQYSKAMSGSGLTWTKANLDKFLAAPQSFVPGTKMTFFGLRNPQDRDNLITYLATTPK